jgi:hypothetical protein
MMALILAELTQWNHELGHRTLSILTCCSTLAVLLFNFVPEFYFWGMIIVFGWIGSSIGERGDGNIHLEPLVGNARLTRRQVILGEITAAVIIGLFHIIALIPVAILSAFLWGVPGIIIGKAGMLFLATTVVAAGFRIVIKRFKMNR